MLPTVPPPHNPYPKHQPKHISKSHGLSSTQPTTFPKVNLWKPPNPSHRYSLLSSFVRLRDDTHRWTRDNDLKRRNFDPKKWRKDQAFPEDRYVSYYVEGLPTSWNHKCLYNAIGKWEEIVDAFVPAKRNVRGQKFGFVRFLRSKGSEEVRGRRLNALKVDDHKLAFNLAKYSVNRGKKAACKIEEYRDRLKRQRMKWVYGQSTKNNRKEGTMVRKRFLNKDKGRDERTFADVVKGSDKNGSSLVDIACSLKKNEDLPVWFEHSVVGTLANGFNDLKEIPDVVEIRPFGGDVVLLTFHSCQAMEEALKKRAVSWLRVFSDVHPWRPSDRSQRRWCWLQLRELPVHVWGVETFIAIVKKFSSLIKVDASTISFVRLEAARVCILTACSQTVEGMVTVIVDDVPVQVYVKEETSWESPFDFLNREGLGSNMEAQSQSPTSCTATPRSQKERSNLERKKQVEVGLKGKTVGPCRQFLNDIGPSNWATSAEVEEAVLMGLEFTPCVAENIEEAHGLESHELQGTMDIPNGLTEKGIVVFKGFEPVFSGLGLAQDNFKGTV